MVVVTDKSAETFKQVIRDHVHEGSVVWTDGHASYGWMDTDDNYTHETVIHRRGEFARLRADGVVISTNAIEGLFSRTKRMLRRHHAAPRSKNGYGLHLGEFLWRSRFVNRGKAGWRRRAFFELVRAIHSTCPAPLHNDGITEPIEFDAWFSETFEWLKREFAAPQIRCGRGRRPTRADARPRRNPREADSAQASGCEPICDTLAADLEEVINENTQGSRKRPPSPEPLADAGPTGGVLIGTGRVRRVRRRRDLPTAYMQVYSRAANPPAGAPPAEPAAPAGAPPGNPCEFTPTSVTDGTRCLARTWNQGRGGQCACAPESGSNPEVCRRHRLPAQQSHGLVNGPIPEAKLIAFQKLRRGEGPAAAAQQDGDDVADPPGTPENVEIGEANSNGQAERDVTPGRENVEADREVDAAPALDIAEVGLGDRIRGVPVEVHERMIDLLSQGLIPLTTFDQRSRRGTAIRTRGTSYEVSSVLQEAFDYGYTSPNFADAYSARWVRQPGGFQLRHYPRGG
jgi:transposase-like protein